jgi:hypothetical protein
VAIGYRGGDDRRLSDNEPEPTPVVLTPGSVRFGYKFRTRLANDRSVAWPAEQENGILDRAVPSLAPIAGSSHSCSHSPRYRNTPEGIRWRAPRTRMQAHFRSGNSSRFVGSALF